MITVARRGHIRPMVFLTSWHYDLEREQLGRRAWQPNESIKKMVTPENIKKWIEQNLAESEVEISGDGRHFFAVIVCAGFAGKTRIQQHQMVYAALGDKMKDDIHALSMHTMSPKERAAETMVNQ